MATASNKSRSDTGGFLWGGNRKRNKGGWAGTRDIPDAKKMLMENEGIEVGYKNGLAGGLIG